MQLRISWRGIKCCMLRHFSWYVKAWHVFWGKFLIVPQSGIRLVSKDSSKLWVLFTCFLVYWWYCRWWHIIDCLWCALHAHTKSTVKYYFLSLGALTWELGQVMAVMRQGFGWSVSCVQGWHMYVFFMIDRCSMMCSLYIQAVIL